LRNLAASARTALLVIGTSAYANVAPPMIRQAMPVPSRRFRRVGLAGVIEPEDLTCARLRVLRDSGDKAAGADRTVIGCGAWHGLAGVRQLKGTMRFDACRQPTWTGRYRLPPARCSRPEIG